jgi:hypothetical protein
MMKPLKSQMACWLIDQCFISSHHTKEATLHPSVLERFKEVEVLQADLTLPCKPEGLREYVKVAGLYGVESDKSVA